MKLCFLLVFLVTVVAAFADDAIKIVSPDNTTTLVVDKSGKRDLIILHSGKIRHRLFYEEYAALSREPRHQMLRPLVHKIPTQMRETNQVSPTRR